MAATVLALVSVDAAVIIIAVAVVIFEVVLFVSAAEVSTIAAYCSSNTNNSYDGQCCSRRNRSRKSDTNELLN